MRPLILNHLEEEMLSGKRGEAQRLAMSILTTMGDLYGAKRMIPVTQGHIDGCSYAAVWDAGLEFAERLGSLGARVSVPTTLNITARDIEDWREFRIPEDHAAKCARMEAAYHAMGCIPTWTCAPYQYGLAPAFGQQIAWAESNAINYANSVLGARTNRYGDLVDICCAIAGRVPEYGLHLKENRAGQILFKFEGIDPAVFSDTSTYAAIGYLVGGIAGERIPVLDGLPASTTHEDLKALSAAAASSGAVGLFHVVGVTPEATTMGEAFQGRRPEEVLAVDQAMLESARDSLTSARQGAAPDGEVDLVIIGCPHSSYMEIERVLDRLRGRRIHKDIQFWIQTNRTVDMLLKRTGLRELLDSLGVRLLHDGCILNFPLDHWGFKGIVTNSGKMAHYAPGHSGASVYFRSLDDCVESAVAGEVRCGE